MKPARVKKIRKELGMTQAEFAKALKLTGSGDRTIRLWESGAHEVSGPASIAIEFLYEKFKGGRL